MLIRIKIDKRRDSIESLTSLRDKLVEAKCEICENNKCLCDKCPDKFFCHSLMLSADYLSNYITTRRIKDATSNL